MRPRMATNGKAPLPGQIMRFPELARTLRELVPDGFYKGRVAEAIVELINNGRGAYDCAGPGEP